MLLLLFLTIPFVYSRRPRCPEDFIPIKRTPTAKNHHTTDYCIGGFMHGALTDRNVAHNFCASKGAMLAIPESQEELDLWSQYFKHIDFMEPFAIDGQLTPRCKSKLFVAKHKGFPKESLCKNNEAYEFTDSNTDPTFVLDRISKNDPIFQEVTDEEDMKRFNTPECLTMRTSKLSNNHTQPTIYPQYCVETKVLDALPVKEAIFSIVCGTRPY